MPRTAGAAFHDEAVRGIHGPRRIQCDEIWSYCYSKAKNAPRVQKAFDHAGDVWTWTALDRDSKLIISWLTGGRDSDSAIEFADDLRSRPEDPHSSQQTGMERTLRPSKVRLVGTWTRPSR